MNAVLLLAPKTKFASIPMEVTRACVDLAMRDDLVHAEVMILRFEIDF